MQTDLEKQVQKKRIAELQGAVDATRVKWQTELGKLEKERKELQLKATENLHAEYSKEKSNLIAQAKTSAAILVRHDAVDSFIGREATPPTPRLSAWRPARAKQDMSARLPAASRAFHTHPPSVSSTLSSMVLTNSLRSYLIAAGGRGGGDYAD